MSEKGSLIVAEIGNTGSRLRRAAGPVIGWSVLSAVALAVIAVVVGFFLTGEQRGYSGTATVVDTEMNKICDVLVTTPGRAEYRYSLRSDSDYCSSLAPGTTVTIEDGEIVSPAPY